MLVESWILVIRLRIGFLNISISIVVIVLSLLIRIVGDWFISREIIRMLIIIVVISLIFWNMFFSGSCEVVGNFCVSFKMIFSSEKKDSMVYIIIYSWVMVVNIFVVLLFFCSYSIVWMLMMIFCRVKVSWWKSLFCVMICSYRWLLVSVCFLNVCRIILCNIRCMIMVVNKIMLKIIISEWVGVILIFKVVICDINFCIMFFEYLVGMMIVG